MCSSKKKAPPPPPPPPPVQPTQASVNVDTKRRNQGSNTTGGFASVQGGTLLTGPQGAGSATTGRTLLG